MARYSINEIPPDMLAQNASNDMLIFTAVLAFFIGIILTYLGKKGKQLWLFVWSIGLMICSLGMGISIWLIEA